MKKMVDESLLSIEETKTDKIPVKKIKKGAKKWGKKGI